MEVSRSTDKNSCPPGYKIWSPRNKMDWQIVYIALGKDLSNYPNNTIVDVTHPYDNYCPGCKDNAMKSTNANIGTLWRTSDGSDWWLRDTKFREPSGDYSSNCYITVTNPDPNNVQFNDYNCDTHDGGITPFSKASEYFCQATQGKRSFNAKPDVLVQISAIVPVQKIRAQWFHSLNTLIQCGK